jgi:GTPase
VGIEWKSRRLAPSVTTPSESLDELAELAATAGAEVAARVVQVREAADAATLIGSGKVTGLQAEVASHGAALVVFDHDLTPTQQRNLERAIGVKVIDRTQLILDIFASRARTREGRLQVELAQLNYLLPRLAGHGVEMSRLGGGIGTRGPGETQLETDRRRIKRRIKKIEDDLEGVRSGRALHRQKRGSVPLATLALAGYTNAGKSTIFNLLTSSNVVADARLFATLDPTVRPLDLPSRRRVLLSDTVGFIANLPTTLVKAFRATLEEVAEAAIILHVVDMAAPCAAAHCAQVAKVLDEIEAASIPRILVLNKLDQFEGTPPDLESLMRRLAGSGDHPSARAVAVSARTGQGIPELLTAIDEILLLDPVVSTTLRLPVGDGATLALLHQCGRVLAERFGDHHWEVDAEIPASLARVLATRHYL